MDLIKGMIISPTGKGVRSDKAGAGHYHASRGDRLHQGMDFLCTPGQDIVCPIDNATAVRHAYPYADQSYGGVLLRSSRLEILLFYFTPSEAIFNKTLFQGTIIGTAQDITKRYNSPYMQPHIHLQIDSADPELFLKEALNAS